MNAVRKDPGLALNIDSKIYWRQHTDTDSGGKLPNGLEKADQRILHEKVLKRAEPLLFNMTSRWRPFRIGYKI